MKGDRRIKKLKKECEWWQIDTDAYANNPYVSSNIYVFKLIDGNIAIAQQVYEYVVDKERYDEVTLSVNDIKRLYDIITKAKLNQKLRDELMELIDATCMKCDFPMLATLTNIPVLGDEKIKYKYYVKLTCGICKYSLIMPLTSINTEILKKLNIPTEGETPIEEKTVE